MQTVSKNMGSANGVMLTGAQDRNWKVRILQDENEIRSPAVRSRWAELMRASSNVNLLFQSPDWFDHLRSVDREAQIALAVVEQRNGDIAGVVPLRIARYALSYNLGGRALCQATVCAASLLGSQLLLPEDRGLYEVLFAAVRQRFPECAAVYFRSVPVGSFVWRCLYEGPGAAGWICHLLDNVHHHHLIQLPAGLPEFLARFSSRTRKGLKHDLRQFESSSPDGVPSLVRVDTVAQVDAFMEAAAAVSRKSWQHTVLGARFEASPQQRERLADLAARGILRSYLLRYKGVPCAFSLGYQFGEVFHDFEVGFDRDYARLSPGTVLMLLMIDDLARHNPPRLYNFGLGDAPYKRRFSTSYYDEAVMMLFPRTLANQLRVTLHAAFLRVRSLLRLGGAA